MVVLRRWSPLLLRPWLQRPAFVRCTKSACSEEASASATRRSKKCVSKAADRRRRIMFNNDGGEVVKEMSQTTAEDLLKQRITPLAGTQVDTFVFAHKRLD